MDSYTVVAMLFERFRSIIWRFNKSTMTYSRICCADSFALFDLAGGLKGFVFDLGVESNLVMLVNINECQPQLQDIFVGYFLVWLVC
jgi:hypothetical protein